MISYKNLLHTFLLNFSLIQADRVSSIPYTNQIDYLTEQQRANQVYHQNRPILRSGDVFEAELALLYDGCHEADFKKYVLNGVDDETKVANTVCEETENEGLSCQLFYEREEIFIEDSEDGDGVDAENDLAISFNCFKLPITNRNYHYWTYSETDPMYFFLTSFFLNKIEDCDIYGGVLANATATSTADAKRTSESPAVETKDDRESSTIDVESLTIAKKLLNENGQVPVGHNTNKCLSIKGDLKNKFNPSGETSVKVQKCNAKSAGQQFVQVFLDENNFAICLKKYHDGPEKSTKKWYPKYWCLTNKFSAVKFSKAKSVENLNDDAKFQWFFNERGDLMNRSLGGKRLSTDKSNNLRFVQPKYNFDFGYFEIEESEN